ncbi:hypothetical protein Tco_0772613 [Tanacetum coccineum]|uniref:Uncharacterized protein n=1 Tax=Tanacetum coccineum TaxID=301880 RepID=A0ABQ4ZLA8_9ASTR
MTNGPKEFQAPASTLQTEESVIEGTKSGAKTRRRKSIHKHSKHSSSKLEAPIFGPLSKEASKAPKGQSKKKKSTTANDKYLSQPSVSTLVIAEMHKEAQQATSGLTSLEVTGEVRSDTQLNIVVLASTTEPIFTTSTILHYEYASGRTNLSVLVDKIKSAMIGLKTAHETEPELGTLLTKLLANSLKPEFDKLIKAHDFSSFIPTDLKELPTKFEAVNGTMDDNGADAISSVSHKAENSSVPSAGQADTHPAEREKITNQATITQLFQRRQAKDPTNMNKQPTQMRG